MCVAMDAHKDYCYKNYGREAMLQGVDGFGAWRAALQAVFDHIGDDNKMVDNICLHSYKIESFKEYPVCSKCGEVANKPAKEILKKEQPKKQTLLEYTDELFKYKGKVLYKSAYNRRGIYKIISEYLEKQDER